MAAAAGNRRMVQKEGKAALEERDADLNSSPVASAGAALEPQAASGPGDDHPAGAAAAAGAGAVGGARRFLCGVVEGERAPSARSVSRRTVFTGGLARGHCSLQGEVRVCSVPSSRSYTASSSLWLLTSLLIAPGLGLELGRL